ncbi:MAG: HEAT repeat domain-containing protein [Desulfobacterales bacterium]|nr:MAG: HEAT repeat domain-containing protein [Desulfobacterales bacterium]
MQVIPFDINYRSAEKFFQDYLQLKAGKLFVQAENPVPKDSPLALNFSVPRIDYTFQINGIVLKTRGRKIAEQVDKPPGMLVGVKDDLEKIFDKLDLKLLADEKYQFLLALCDTLQDSGSIIAYDSIDEEAATTCENPSVSSSTPNQESPPTVGDGQQSSTADAATDPAQKCTAAQSAEMSGEEESQLNFEWLREAIAQEEAVIEEAPPPEIKAPPTQDKKNLTSEERDKVKPVADFIMDLTKAMLRSGYYSPKHPGAQKAKKGLHAQFLKCLGESQEIMITDLETPQKKDILITGILDEPVSVRTLVGAGMAELFVPKLTEFFNRKGLISFAIKKQITAAHFESYIDIMSDPRADQGRNKKMGELLSRALAKNGISEISTIFMDDIIVLEKNLPWRVEMAIQRLTKDLKILPMFKGKSDEAILHLKVKIIHDIIRPLKYGEYLKELLVNCYIIAQHVENIESEEIEGVVIEGMPPDLLLPTSHYVFEDLKELNELKTKEAPTAAFQRRHQGVKRIIKNLSRRLIQQKAKGAQKFLEEMHNSNVLAFKELPPDVQYLVNTMKIVRDVKARLSVYINWVFERMTPEDATVMLKCFRRVIPIVLEEQNWKVAFKITLAVNKVKNETDLYSPKNNLPPNPFYFIFKDVSDMLSNAYLTVSTTSRLEIDQIVRRLGSKGLDILNLILIKSENSEVRTDAMETVVSMGEKARLWSLNILQKNKQDAGTLRNALAILREVGKANADTELVKKYAGHSDPQVQEESLHTLISFNAEDLESIILKGLTNPDDKLRWRAVTALGKLKSLSQNAIAQILQIITSDSPDDEQEATVHFRKIAQLIQALGALNNFPAVDRLEEAILKVVQKSGDSGKGLINRLKLQQPKTDQTPILLAAFTTLAKIGSEKSNACLTKFAKGKSAVALEAQKALKQIEARHMKTAAAQAAR